MKVTLLDYQEDAVNELLEKLAESRTRWSDTGQRSTISLTAVPGAGKTVMAAAVLEHLFYGDGICRFDPDPGAVVIWFSDDPSLNAQSRKRLLDASDKLRENDLVVIENVFDKEALECGKVYFLNAQKLTRGGKLTRGHGSEEHTGSSGRPMPDRRSNTIWQTIRNTIEDRRLTLYLFLDEAHRGMGAKSVRGTDSRTTIAGKLISGPKGAPGIPVVLGISATPKRFTEAMEAMEVVEERSTLHTVNVSPEAVQDSGLLKDSIILEMPDKSGRLDAALLHRGTLKLKGKTEAWDKYASEQGPEAKVTPLMVLQVANKPNHREIGKLLDEIFSTWKDLPENAIAHVFGEHTMQQFGKYSVPYIQPQNVQKETDVRVLIAKDAISTGWDCPRAEVMVSFRPAVDRTYIEQLLGRMVRAPLARRISGNDHLNAVDCLLSNFDKENVAEIVEYLMNGGKPGSDIPGTLVIQKPVSVSRNPAVHDDVFKKFNELPTQSLKSRQPRPIGRLMSLAHALATDDILKNAGKRAQKEMHKVLDGLKVQYKEKIDSARREISSATLATLHYDLSGKKISPDEFHEVPHASGIDEAYRHALRKFSRWLATSYGKHLVEASTRVGEDEVATAEATEESRKEIAAMGQVDELVKDVEAKANKTAGEWFDEHDVGIRRLNESRRSEYAKIKKMSGADDYVKLVFPNIRIEDTVMRDGDKGEKPVPTFLDHLLCDDKGKYPAKLNKWEMHVYQREAGRKDFAGWYRNPSRAVESSLGISFDMGDARKITRPDFIFFSKDAEGKFIADIVDPHGQHFSDFLARAKGMAEYAKKHGKHFSRIEIVLEVKGEFKAIKLQNENVREIVLKATDPTELHTDECMVAYK